MVLPAMVISISRAFALGQYYHAPLDIAYHFQFNEIPKLLLAAGYKPTPPPEGYQEAQAQQGQRR